VRTAAEVEAATRDVDGWLGPLEGRLLYSLAAAADPKGWIVEIGSWQGKSTIWLAAGARSGRGARVAAIDPHRGTDLRTEGETTEPALRSNLERAGVTADVEVVVATSADAEATWSRPVSLLWIDGDHSYEGALLDLDRWERHLLPDGAVAFHDTFTIPGPDGSPAYSGFEWAETTSAARRSSARNARDRLARRSALARRALYATRLRAYDRNTLGFARAYTALSRLRRN
jgi:MMP 1-O-methyltransferase